MILTLKIAPDVMALLTEQARQRGQSVADYTAKMVVRGAEWEARMEAAEDAEDIADADRIMAKSDPAKRRTLAQLRAAIDEQRGARQTKAA